MDRTRARHHFLEMKLATEGTAKEVAVLLAAKRGVTLNNSPATLRRYNRHPAFHIMGFFNWLDSITGTHRIADRNRDG